MMMGRIQRALGFQPIPVSTILFLSYFVLWLAVYASDQLAAIPAENDVNVTQALSDLQRITARPHPYNSHANDDVRDLIFRTIIERNQDIEIVVDRNSSGKWVSSTVIGVPAVASYFEGNNILVRIPGTAEKSTPGVLFSAHYDSVSTAPGATDDGIGISALLQLISYFQQHPPRRTVVFNINNGEEDGLHGAHAFLLHTWASEVKTFVNLEGAAAGGPVLPFRATSEDIMRAYHKGVNNYHANVLSADAFERGMIRSGTDYQVYIANGMRGVDFAFYRGRARYHTRYDAIPWMEGKERALWDMIQAALGTGIALVNEGDEVNLSSTRKGVWFDIFGRVLFLFSLDSLLTINIVALVVGPITVLLLLALQISFSRSRAEGHDRRLVSDTTPIVRALWGGLKYWIGLAAVVGVQVGWVVGWVHLNPFMLHTYPYTVMVSTFTLSILAFLFVVNLPFKARSNTDEPQPSSPLPLLFHTYLLTYLLLIICTVLITKSHVSGTYLITVWNVLVWLGCVVGTTIGRGGLIFSGKQTLALSGEEEGGRSDQTQENREGGHGLTVQAVSEENERTTEHTPLLARSRSPSPTQSLHLQITDHQTTYTWLPLLLIVLPLPLILLSQVVVILVGALSPTLADGGSPSQVYILFAMLSGIAGSFSWPFLVARSSSSTGSFAGGLHRYLVLLLAVVFVVTTVPGWLAGLLNGKGTTLFGFSVWTESCHIYPPFTPETPLKVFFQQSLQISPSISSTGTVTIVPRTTLTGVAEFLEDWIVPRIPSARNVICSNSGVDKSKAGLTKCSWPSGQKLIPAPGGDHRVNRSTDVPGRWDWVASPNIWFDARARNEVYNDPSGPAARISVLGRNTRNCRVYFDQPVYKYRVVSEGYEDNWELQDGEILADTGINEVRLWTRDWDKRLDLEVVWKNKEEGERTGHVACEWAEYESGMVGLPAQHSASKIPAFEEVLTFLPRWAVVSKLSDGLVEVSEEFSF
ncbi:hypothetical protein E1B28_007318 [Marasmius oreades]|uniref:Peptide hydrolase n=1 Tax=Marasmius oreades TaxID=181124 RepID=A0A9P7S1E7_9AGAR|nr:uncharacterized protein E1B28_007318 [Marasmius oreades]KAG7093656.1 hypothetical protein E1B28_007318 [Marasmius oreades]